MRRPWHVGEQLTLVAWHPDGTIWRPKPDIMVHAHAGPTRRDEMSATADGLPALIIEVASPSTYLSDVNISPPTALWLHRLAHHFYLKGYRLGPRPLALYARFIPGGIDIHPGASIGHRFFIDHEVLPSYPAPSGY
jgi:hypothetical protein